MKKDIWLELEKEEFDLEYAELKAGFSKGFNSKTFWDEFDKFEEFVNSKIKKYCKVEYTIEEICYIMSEVSLKHETIKRIAKKYSVEIKEA